MRITLAVFFLLVAEISWCQTFVLDCQNEPLVEVLNRIQTEHELYFSYSNDLVDGKTVTLRVETSSKQALLDTLLHPLGLAAFSKSKSFYVIGTYTENRSITVHVSDYLSAAALPFAYVKLGIDDFYQPTDGQGNITVKANDLRLGLEVSYVGYTSFSSKLQLVAKAGNDTMRIALNPVIKGLSVVTILEYINSAIALKDDYSTIELRPDAMEVLPGLPESDILLTTQMIPGVESNDETASGLNVRGGQRDQLLIYWDRIPVYHTAHYFGSITSLIPSAVTLVNVYRNYIPASYNGGASGLLDIHAFDKPSEKASGEVNLTSTHVDATARLPISKVFSIDVAARSSYNHLITTPTFNAYTLKLFEGSKVEVFEDASSDLDDETGLSTQLAFNDLNAKLTWKPNVKNTISASFLANGNRFNLWLEEDEFDNSSFQDHEVWSRGFNVFQQRKWSNTWSIEASYSMASYEMQNTSKLTRFEEGEDSITTSIDMNNELINHEVKGQLHYQKNDKWNAELGYQFNSIHSSFVQENQETFEPDLTDTLEFQENIHGIWLGAQTHLGKLMVQPQLRVDYFSNQEEILVKPVIASRYQVSRSLAIKASAGRYSQFIRLLDDNELNVTNITEGVWVVADGDDVDIFTSEQASLGFALKKGGWLVDIDGFYKSLDGVIASNQYQEQIDEDNEIDFVDGTGTVRGIDVMVKSKTRHYSPWLSYSFSKATSYFEEYSDEAFPSFLDRPHQLHFVNTFVWKNLESSLGYTFKSGAPYSTPVGFKQIEEEDDIYYIIDWNTLNNSRLPSYQRFDLSVWYKFRSDQKHWRGKMGLSIVNFTNRSNVWRRTFFLEEADDDETPELIQEEQYFLGITPSFSLKLTY